MSSCRIVFRIAVLLIAALAVSTSACLSQGNNRITLYLSDGSVREAVLLHADYSGLVVDLSGLSWDGAPPDETVRRIPRTQIDSVFHAGRCGRTFGSTVVGGALGVFLGIIGGALIGGMIDEGGSSGSDGLIDMPNISLLAGAMIGAGAGLLIGAVVALPPFWSSSAPERMFKLADGTGLGELRRRSFHANTSLREIPRSVLHAPDLRRP
jgi:hypothetical protein